MIYRSYAIALGMAILLSACGGGNSSSTNSTNNLSTPSTEQITANAGGNYQVYSNSTAILAGLGNAEGTTAYDQYGKKKPLSYLWTQTSGIPVALQNPTSLTTYFTTPIVTQNSSLQFTLTVQNSQGQTASDNTNITVQPQPNPAQVSLGAHIVGDGWDKSVIDQFNSDTGAPVGIVNLFSSFDKNWSSLRALLTNIHARNAAPLVTWEPTDNNRPNDNLLPEISSGQWDNYIQQWISDLKAWQATYPANAQPHLLIRFGHEFNGKWYPWGNDPSHYIAAWQYLHNQFSAAQVQNVEWVWCVNNVNVDDYNNINLYYPGNAYVDWLSIDGYNWGSNYSYSRWRNFDGVFLNAYNTLVSNYPTKPIMLAEVASAEPADQPNPNLGQDGNDSDANESKIAWISDMFTRIQTSYPAIRSVIWFNTDKSGLRWALNGIGHTGATAYQQQALRQQYFGGNYTPANQYQTASVASFAYPASVSANTAPDSEADALRQLPLEQLRALRRH